MFVFMTCSGQKMNIQETRDMLGLHFDRKVLFVIVVVLIYLQKQLSKVQAMQTF